MAKPTFDNLEGRSLLSPILFGASPSEADPNYNDYLTALALQSMTQYMMSNLPSPVAIPVEILDYQPDPLLNLVQPSPSVSTDLINNPTTVNPFGSNYSLDDYYDYMDRMEKYEYYLQSPNTLP